MRPTYIASCVLLLTHVAVAQPPSPPNRNGGGRGEGAAPTAEAFIQKLMSLDANQDGKLTREEVTDVRLHPLLARADANQDGSVTQEELKELHAKESATLGGGRGGPGGPGGGPGSGGPGGGGPGGQGGPNGAGGGRGMRGGMGGGPGGMSGGPPKPGEVLPSFLQEELQLTERQKTQLSALQKDVDARLAKILTAEQKEQLTRMRDRGPGGGPGGPGGPGGGGPGGNGDGPPGPPPGGNEEARGRRPPSE